MAEYMYYERGFTEESRKLINELIKLDVDKRILDLATQINEDKIQVFNYDEIDRIFCDTMHGCSFDDIKRYAINYKGCSVYDASQMGYIVKIISGNYPAEFVNAFTKLNSDMKPVYDEEYMDVIVCALEDKVPVSKIKDTIRLNKNEKPIYGDSQAEQIFNGISDGLKEDEIDFYSSLNSSGEPIFSASRMNVIRFGMNQKIPLEYVKIFAKCKDEKPLYTYPQMDVIRNFITKFINTREIDKIKQLKECVNKELTFGQLHPFLLYNVPPENIRLYRSLYELGLNAKDAEEMMIKDESYENLKELKYLLRCANELGLEEIKIFTTHLLNIDEKRNTLAADLSVSRSISDHDTIKLVEKFLSFQLPPDQIDFLIKPEHLFSNEEMKTIAIGFLNGIDTEKMKSIVFGLGIKKYKTVSDIKNEINELINSKMSSEFKDEEEFDFYSESENILDRGE